MKTLYALPLILLCACSNIKTPEDRWLATTVSATVAANVAQNYTDDCKTKATSDPCYANLPKINSAAKITLKAKQQADRVFITKDIGYYELSLAALENAIANLTNLIKG